MEQISCKNCHKIFSSYKSNKSIFCSRDCYAKSITGKPHGHKTNNGNTPWNKGRKGRQKNHNIDGLKLGHGWNKGEKSSPEWIEKNRIANLGRKHSMETKRKMSEAHRGEKNYQWIQNRELADEKARLRRTQEWKLWRSAIFARDSFTCKDCGAIKVYLEPHHIIPIRSDKNKLFDTNNGITLCRPCHQKTIWKESNFAKKYSAIVVAQRLAY